MALGPVLALGSVYRFNWAMAEGQLPNRVENSHVSFLLCAQILIAMAPALRLIAR
jgi:ligand-binding sensor protein